MLPIGCELMASLLTANRSYIIEVKKVGPSAMFYCGDEVRMRDPDTGTYGGIFWVARVQLDEETGYCKHDLNSEDRVLVHTGVKEKAPQARMMAMSSLERIRDRGLEFSYTTRQRPTQVQSCFTLSNHMTRRFLMINYNRSARVMQRGYIY